MLKNISPSNFQTSLGVWQLLLKHAKYKFLPARILFAVS
jgi:hypothetical protein